MPLEGRKYKNGTGFSLNPKLLGEMPKKVALKLFLYDVPGQRCGDKNKLINLKK